MSYMATLSESQSKAADWVLCTDSKELPCHSLLLSSFSSVLSGLQETKPRDDGKIAVPFRGNYQAAEQFLQFCYHRNPVVLSLEESYELSLLSHEWNIPGLSLFFCSMHDWISQLKELGHVLEMHNAMILCRPCKSVRCQSRQAYLTGQPAARDPDKSFQRKSQGYGCAGLGITCRPV